jgi:hypothetical protein
LETIGRVLERGPATPDEGSAKQRRVAVKDLPEGVAGAVVTTVWGIPQRLGCLEYKLRFGVICDAHPVWGWSGPLMRGKLSWVASKQSVSKAFWSTLGNDAEWHEGDVSTALVAGVDVILFEISNGPGPSHPLWDCPGLKMVVWFSNKSRFRPPSHWTLWTTRIRHTDLGGVMDGSH